MLMLNLNGQRAQSEKLQGEKIKLSWHHAMKAYEGIAPSFLALAIHGDEGPFSRPCRFTPLGKIRQDPLDRRLDGLPA
jgi:hypothetical protein